MEVTRISQLEHPTDAQIEEMTQLAAEAFDKTILNTSMTAGVRERSEDLYRLIFRAAALEGELYICQAVNSGRIVSLAAGFGPGTSFLGSEAQRSLGFAELFNELQEDTKNWWRENLLKANQKPGDEKGLQSLRLITVATLGEEQRKGHGSSLIKEITRTVGTPVRLNVNTDINMLFYKRLGFKIVSTSEMTSSYGSWVRTTMMWEDPSTISPGAELA